MTKIEFIVIVSLRRRPMDTYVFELRKDADSKKEELERSLPKDFVVTVQEHWDIDGEQYE